MQQSTDVKNPPVSSSVFSLSTAMLPYDCISDDIMAVEVGVRRVTRGTKRKTTSDLRKGIGSNYEKS
jgi:hypothetical protein